MAVAQQVSHVLPLGTRVNERGRLEVGGCDLVELAREVGTPAYVVAEDDLRARARAFRAAFARPGRRRRDPLRRQGLPLHRRARALRPGGPGLRRGGRRRARRGAARRLRPRPHPRARQRQVRGGPAQALDAGVGHIVLDNAAEIDRLERLLPRGRRPARADAHRSRASAPTRTRRSPRAGPTRSSASTSTRRAARSRASRRRTGSGSKACTSTSARRSSTWRRSARRWRRSPPWATSTS